MSDPFIERLFAGIPEEIAKLRPLIAEIEAFNARNAAADELVVARGVAAVELAELEGRLADDR